MNLNRNDILILSELIQSSRYISAKELGVRCSLSSRQIREQIAQLKKIMSSSGYELLSERSKGYLLKPVFPNTFQDLEEELNRLKNEESRNLDKSKDRPHEILVRLVEENGYLKVNTMAEEMMISRSTFLNCLKEAKQSLARYDLRLSSKPNYGLCVLGTEYSKRKLILDLIFGSGQANEMIYYLLNQPETSSLPERKIIDIIKKHHLILSDEGCFDFLLYLSTMLSRISAGCRMESSRQQMVRIPDRYTDAGNEIYDYLKNAFGIPENPYERNQIPMELVSKCTLQPADGTAFEYKEQIIIKIAQEFEKIYGISFLSDLEFQKDLSLLIESILYHIVFFTKQRSSLYHSQKDHFYMEKPFASIVQEVLRNQFGHGPGAGDMLRLQTFFHTFQMKRSRIKRRVLVVGGTDSANNELLQFFLKAKHSYYVDSVDVSPLYLLDSIPEESYDVIVSVIPVPEDLKKPYVCVSPLLLNTDHARIENFLKILNYQQSAVFLFDPRLFIITDQSKIGYSPILLTERLERENFAVDLEDRNNLIRTYEETLIDYENGLYAFRFHFDAMPWDVIVPIVFEGEKERKVVFAVSHRHAGASIFNYVQSVLEHLRQSEVKDLLNDPALPTIVRHFYR